MSIFLLWGIRWDCWTLNNNKKDKSVNNSMNKTGKNYRNIGNVSIELHIFNEFDKFDLIFFITKLRNAAI